MFVNIFFTPIDNISLKAISLNIYTLNIKVKKSRHGWMKKQRKLINNIVNKQKNVTVKNCLSLRQVTKYIFNKKGK